MQDSQTILVNLGVPLPQNPSGMDPQGLINRWAGGFVSVWEAIQTGTYNSPLKLPLPRTLPGLILLPDETWADAIQKLVDDPKSGDNGVVADAMDDATVAYEAIVTTGDLQSIHAAVDSINALLPLTKQPGPFVPPSDLALQQDAPGIIGQISQLCGPGQTYFVYHPSSTDDPIMQAAIAGTGDPRMQPVLFFPG